MERFSTILTSEQAALLYDLVKANLPFITERRSFGFYDGLLQSLMNIDRGGGAYVRGRLLDYGSELVEAGIIPASTYFAWPGVRIPVPMPYWDVAATVPRVVIEHQGQRFDWEPLRICHTKGPLAIVPLTPAVLPVGSLPGLPLIHRVSS